MTEYRVVMHHGGDGGLLNHNVTEGIGSRIATATEYPDVDTSCKQSNGVDT